MNVVRAADRFRPRGSAEAPRSAPVDDGDLPCEPVVAELAAARENPANPAQSPAARRVADYFRQVLGRPEAADDPSAIRDLLRAKRQIDGCEKFAGELALLALGLRGPAFGEFCETAGRSAAIRNLLATKKSELELGLGARPASDLLRVIAGNPPSEWQNRPAYFYALFDLAVEKIGRELREEAKK